MIDIDIPSQLAAIYRRVGLTPADDVGVLLRRNYNAEVEDVWEALTDPDRMKRWFMPITGELRVGGSFQLHGNAGGDILECDPPTRFKVTFGGPTSIVEVRLRAEGEETVLELEHTVPLTIAQSVAGALYVGPGWDGALMALDLYTRGQVVEDPAAAASSREVQAFSKASVGAWEAAVREAAGASEEEIAGAVQVSLAQFSPDVKD
jgi:uncharacterized protein YndB with AHSA1/START domain